MGGAPVEWLRWFGVPLILGDRRMVWHGTIHSNKIVSESVVDGGRIPSRVLFFNSRIVGSMGFPFYTMVTGGFGGINISGMGLNC